MKAATPTHATVTNTYTLTVTAVPVEFLTLTANGTSGVTTTTVLTLEFDVNPTTLEVDDITVSGATRGALTGTGTSRTLEISNVTAVNGANITVQIANPTGFTITGSPKDVAANVAIIPSTIVFADGATVSKAFGSGAYTNPVSVSSVGDGVITYSSGTLETATVSATTGEVTIVAVGSTVITATKAATPTHATVTNTYTITVVEAVVSIADIDGVTAPVAGATPVSAITETDQYTGTIIWEPTDSTFEVKPYTAHITLEAKPGYTLNGVGANSFRVLGASVVENETNSGQVTAWFPQTLDQVVNLDWYETKIQWSEVYGASNYQVQLYRNSGTVEVHNVTYWTYYDFAENMLIRYGDTVTVQAMGDGRNYKDGPARESAPYIPPPLNTVGEVRCKSSYYGTPFYWDEVYNASSYLVHVYRNGVFLEDASVDIGGSPPHYDGIGSVILAHGQGSYTVSVQAMSNGAYQNGAQSPESSAIVVNSPWIISTPSVNETSNPTIVVNLSGANFKDAATTPDNWDFGTQHNGLTVVSITKNSATQVTITFSGTLTEGQLIRIQATTNVTDRSSDSNTIYDPRLFP